MAGNYKVSNSPVHSPPENYIREIDRQSGLTVSNDKDVNQVSNDDLLQIISSGINNIVLELKQRLGRNFNESNRNAYSIKKLLDDLGNTIITDANIIGKNVNVNPDGSSNITVEKEARQINFDHNTRLLTVNPIDPTADDYYRSDLYGNAQITSENINANQTFKNLNSKFEHVLTENINQRQRITEWGPIINNPSIDNNITNRLMNCENLEFLYLKKHEEIMKIFAFTINLFDKYKYAIKVILFLLKNLVNKDKETVKGGITTVDLPKPIIKNIKKLVDDQLKVQGVIDNMNIIINDKPPYDRNLMTKLGFPTELDAKRSIEPLGKLTKKDSAPQEYLINENLKI